MFACPAADSLGRPRIENEMEFSVNTKLSPPVTAAGPVAEDSETSEKSCDFGDDAGGRNLVIDAERDDKTAAVSGNNRR